MAGIQYNPVGDLMDIAEIGANWFFNNGFGLNLEFGFPFSKFGVTFKF